MRAAVTGSSVFLLLLLNTLILIGPLMLVAVGRLVLPGRRLRRACARGVTWIAETWVSIDKGIFNTFIATRWDVRGVGQLSRRRSYLVVSNHQSWVDIPALMEALLPRTSFFKFFLKQELIWVPLLGLAWWALDYPFMKRYSKAKLARHPELQGKDLEITRASCERFRGTPVTLVNYLEGTRFSQLKRDQQGSPYRYLLKPKAGGIALALAVMGEQFDAILDVTLVYPGKQAPGIWALLSGQLSRVIVDVRSLPLDRGLIQGDYQNDADFRQRVQAWVADLWQQKDQRIAELKREITQSPTGA